MPVTTSAKQALRKDMRRNTVNLRRKRYTKKAVDSFKSSPDKKLFSKAISQVDKMVKWQLWHSNKAGRIKSQLSKLLKTS